MSKSDRRQANAPAAPKKGRKHRDGPSKFYYEDENRLNLDYETVQKFGRLSLPPPVEVLECEKTQ